MMTKKSILSQVLKTALERPDVGPKGEKSNQTQSESRLRAQRAQDELAHDPEHALDGQLADEGVLQALPELQPALTDVLAHAEAAHTALAQASANDVITLSSDAGDEPVWIAQAPAAGVDTLARAAQTPATAQEQGSRGGGLLWWTVGGLGVVALAAMTGKSEGFTVQGSVLLGPVVQGHGLMVAIYKADGTELATARVRDDGTYSLRVSQNYSGPILVRVVDESDGYDYRDEASEGLRDLTADLRAMQVITGQGTYTVNLNGLTELAVRMAGLSGGNSGSSVVHLEGINAQQVAALNTQIANAFGLNGVDLVKTQAVAIVNADGSDNHANADNYGRVLAALSGLELGTAQSTDAVLEDLTDQINSLGQLSELGANQLVAGALNVPTLSGSSFASQVGLGNVGNAMADAWAVIRAAADAIDNNAPKPTEAHYDVIGVTGVNSTVKKSLLGDVIDVKAQTAVNALVEVQELADAVSAVINGAAGGTGPTVEQLQSLGFGQVTSSNLSAVQGAIERTVNDGTGVDTLPELQSVVNTAIDSMDIISAYTGHNAVPVLTDYSNIGVTGVTGGNLAVINTSVALLSPPATDSQGEVQALVNGYLAILAAADGMDNNATRPNQAQYAAIGVTGVDSAGKVSLLGDVLDVKNNAAVDTVAEVQALADAVSAVMTGAAGGTGPTLAQLQLIGLSAVTANNLSAVQAAIERTANDGTGVDSWAQLQAIVNAATGSMDIISNYTGSNTAVPALVDYSNISVTGVTNTNLAAINTAIALLNTAASDTQAEVQAAVNGYLAILAAADGTDNNATHPTQAQYAAIGVTGVDSAAKGSLLGDVLDVKNNAAVDTVDEVQALADAVSAVMSGATGGAGPDLAQLQLLGLSTVTANNLSAIQSAIERTANDGTGVDTLSELQALVTTTAASLNIISEYTGSNTVPQLTDYSNVGVTGVNSGNLGAINTAVALLTSAQTDTQVEVQAVVDGYLTILASADGTDNNATKPTQAHYAAIGLTGVDSAAKVSLLGDVLDITGATEVDAVAEVQALADGVGAIVSGADGVDNNPSQPTQVQYETVGVSGVDTAVELSLLGDVIDILPGAAVDTIAELQALAQAVAAVMTGAAGLTPPSRAQLELLGLNGITDSNLMLVQAAIAASPNDGTGVDTLPELRALVGTTVSMDIISNYTGSNTAPSLTDYGNIGVTGVTNGNLAAINTSIAFLGTAATDSQAKVQTAVNGYLAILAAADGTANNATKPTQAQYGAIGVTGVNSAAKVSLLGDVVDGSASLAVDSLSKVQALADAVAAVMDGAAGNTGPTVAQLQLLGFTDVTSNNLATVRGAIAATADDGSGVDTLSELQTVVGFVASMEVISTYTGSNTTPTLSDYSNINVTGVTAGNLAAINTAVALLSTADTDTPTEVQAVVTGYLAILASADGTDNNATKPTQAQYAAIGVTGVNSAAKVSLLGDVVDVSASTAVDTVAKVQALADAVAAVMAGAAGGTGPTVAQLQLLGFANASNATLAAIQAAIAATADDGSGVDTLAELQAIVSGVTNSMDVISAYTGANTAPAVTDYSNIGVTGVTAGNLAAINTAVALLSTADTDTPTEVQAVVTGYLAILASADGIDNNATKPTQAQYAAIGVTGVNSAAKVSLLGDVVDVSASTAVDTVAKVQALADAVAAVMAGAAGGTGPTVAQLQLLGFPSVNNNNLSVAQTAIAATADDGSGVDTLAELQTVIGAIVSLDVISGYDGTNTVPAFEDYAYIGVTGVTSGNVAAINTAIALLSSASTDSQAEVQAVVTGYRAILTAADGTDNNATNATQAQYAAIGVTGIDSSAKVSLLGDVIDVSTTTAVDTVTEVQALATAVAAVMTGAAGGTAPTLSELQLLGVSNVTASNLSAVQAAIAATNDNGSGVDTLLKLQTLINNVNTSLNLISAYTGSNTAPATTDYSNIGVTGVTAGNLGAVNTSVALLSATATDTPSEVQAIVDAYLAVLAAADGTDNNATKPTRTQYEAMGVTGMDTATELALLGDVLDVKASADVDTVAEVQALANAVAAVMTGAAGGSSPTTQQWQLLGFSGISGSLFTDVLNALIATADDGSAVDTLPEVQALVNRAQNPPITAIQLSSIAAGSGGFAIEDSAGPVGTQLANMSSIGDMNGDGLEDILISKSGGAYVVYGRTAAPTTVVPGGWTQALPIKLFDVGRGTGGFFISSASIDEFFGQASSSAGDVNGDGIPDLVIGAPGADVSPSGLNSGKAFVVFGKSTDGNVDFSFTANGKGFVIEGERFNGSEQTGFAVSSAGDVNGDGLADVIIGTPGGNEVNGDRLAGAYVVFGKTGYDTVAVSAVKGGTGGFVIYGAQIGGETGYSVSSVGDINGDGLADLIVGGRSNDIPSQKSGRTFVVLGKTDTTPVWLSDATNGSGGFQILGESAYDYSGFSVSSAGDVNGDGLVDLIIGAQDASRNSLNTTGLAYVVFGSTHLSEIDLADVAQGSGGFQINAASAYGYLGYSVSSAGDFNGDGLADLIVGARGQFNESGQPTGRAYLLYGKTDTTPIDLLSLSSDDGFVIYGETGGFNGNWAGAVVSSAGDVNGDGLADLLVRSPFYASTSNSAATGRAYVIFGRNTAMGTGMVADQMGTTGNNSLSDGGSSQTLVGNAGNDTLTASAASVLYGGSGNDRFEIGQAMIDALQRPFGLGGNLTKLTRIDGGTGTDTLALTGANLTLDLTRVVNLAASNPEVPSRIDSIEKIELTGTGNNTLKLTAFDLMDLSRANLFQTTGRQQLMVNGDAGDTVDLADGTGVSRWTQEANPVTLDGLSYGVWNQSAALATLYVQTGVLVV